MRKSVHGSASPEFVPFLPMGQAISALFYPHVEVVLHDLRSDRIVAIWNAFSRRKQGDPSLFGNIADQLGCDVVFAPYDKASSQGRTIRSASAVVSTEAGERIGLFCINFDVSKIEDGLQVLKDFLQAPNPRPAILFRGDFRESINLIIRDYLESRSLSLSALQRSDRLDLVATLARQGLFETRKAADHIAAALDVSRATVYGLLSAVRAGAGT